MRDSPKKVIVQAVHELFDKVITENWSDDEERVNRLIFIGRLNFFVLKLFKCLMMAAFVSEPFLFWNV